MKTFKVITLTTIAYAAIVWLVTAFITWDANPSNWNELFRSMIAIIYAGIVAGILMFRELR